MIKFYRLRLAFIIGILVLSSTFQLALGAEPTFASHELTPPLPFSGSIFGIESPVQLCVNEPTPLLTVQGYIIAWYDADPAGGNANLIGTGPVFIPSSDQLDMTVPGTTSFYVTESLFGEESPAEEIVVEVTSPSPMPIDQEPYIIRVGDTYPTLTAEGTNLKWYDADPALGAATLLQIGTTFTTSGSNLDVSTVGTTSFYLTQDRGCGESSAREILVDVLAIPLSGFTSKNNRPITENGDNSWGSAWGDYDNDGDLDLYVSNYFETNYLYRNNGDKTFEKITSSQITYSSQSWSSTWVDYNNDGYLDLYVVNGYTDPNRLFRNNGDGTFTRIYNAITNTSDINANNASWADYDNDGDLDLFIANGSNANPETRNENNSFYENIQGTFVKNTSSIIANDGGFSYLGTWGDYDNDGDLDLLVLNIFQDNYFYENNGDKTFTKVLSSPLLDTGSQPRSASWGDFNNDGYLDIVIGSFNHTRVFLNNKDKTFTPTTLPNISGSNTSVGDFDNDGYLDIVFAGAGKTSQLYVNNGDGTFDLSQGEELGTTELDFANGAAVGDYDNDGDLDLFVPNDDEYNVLFENHTDNQNWIKLRLKGTNSNSFGIGAKVSLKSGGIWQLREISSLNAYRNQNSTDASFGLGGNATIDSLTIQWPSGVIDYLTNVTSNRTMIVEEGSYPVVSQPIEVLALCSNNPEVERVWSLNNPRDTALEVYWFVAGTDQSDSLVLQPGDNILNTNTVAEFDNLLTVRWLENNGVQSEVSTASTDMPCRVRGLLLNPVCSDNPDEFRRWELVNRNPFTVPVTWDLIRTEFGDTLDLLPGSTFFTTPAQTGDQFVKIIWLDEEEQLRRQQKLSSEEACATTNTIAVEPIALDQEIDTENSTASSDISIFPNPFANEISLKIKTDSKRDLSYKLAIYNLNGVLIYENLVHSKFGELNAGINTSKFSVGTYILNVTSVDGSYRNTELIIKR